MHCNQRVNRAHRRLGSPSGGQSAPRVQLAEQRAARGASEGHTRTTVSARDTWRRQRLQTGRKGEESTHESMERTSLSRLKRATFSARSVAGSAGSVRSRVARISACGRVGGVRAGGACWRVRLRGRQRARRAPGRGRTRRTGPGRTPARAAPLRSPAGSRERQRPRCAGGSTQPRTCDQRPPLLSARLAQQLRGSGARCARQRPRSPRRCDAG